MELRRRGILGFGSRSFRFAIGPAGLAVRHRGVDQSLPWPDIDALVLNQPLASWGDQPLAPGVPLPLLVPAAGSAAARLPRTARHPIDGRPAVRLLDLNEVRESPDEVAEALARHGGERFTDVRALQGKWVPAVDFTVAPRGYDIASVNRLIRDLRETLLRDGPEARCAALEKISKARFEIALRGYYREQVSELLATVSRRGTAAVAADE
ncbi:hypothetical protein AB0J86_36745 [Micromonospora sp. NPDC049559]|uniref:hypothetical protein n=1 Tax=Micromonospora sp. NPDC049559 TaxID=3155923 RepID=UPI00342FBFD2